MQAEAEATMKDVQSKERKIVLMPAGSYKKSPRKESRRERNVFAFLQIADQRGLDVRACRRQLRQDPYEISLRRATSHDISLTRG